MTGFSESRYYKNELSGAVKCLLRFFAETKDIYANRKICFINAVLTDEMPENCVMQQYLKHEYDRLKTEYPIVMPEIDINQYADYFDLILVNSPAQTQEIKHIIAKSLRISKEGGTIAISAENKSGGKRLESLIAEIGMNYETDSKFKSKIIIYKKQRKIPEELNAWFEYGHSLINQKTSMCSVPGLFSYDKIDKGSEFLTNVIQNQSLQIKGNIADFCCGYGYLSKVIKDINPEKIKTLTCIDTDFRAVECCKINLSDMKQAEFLWEDITSRDFISRNKNRFNLIVMNPPFHEQGYKSIELGVKCISSASQCLKKEGKLYMVSNRKLPYEDILKNCFKSYQTLFEGHGYKIHVAHI